MSENKPKAVINILGCCVSRDTFGFSENNGGYKIAKYTNQFDIFSACDKPIDVDKEQFDKCDCSDLMTRFVKRCLYLDLTKNIFNFIGEVKSDYLIIDVAAARLGTYSVGNTRVCAVPQRKRTLQRLQNKGIIPSDLALNVSKEVYLPREQMADKVRLFADKVLEMYPPDRIILNEIKNSYYYDEDVKDPKSKLSAFNELPQRKMQNDFCAEIFRLLEEMIPQAHVIRMPEYVACDKNHWLHLAPLHFTKEYYEYGLKCIDVITAGHDREKENAELERLYRSYSDYYYNKYYYRFSLSLADKKNVQASLEKNQLMTSFFRDILVKGVDLGEFMRKRGHKSAIIYGWTKVAEYYAHALTQNGMEVVCIVENLPYKKIASNIKEGGIKVVPRTIAKLPPADCVLIADLYKQRQIIPYAAKKSSTRIYTDEDILRGEDTTPVKKYDVGVLGLWSGCNYGSVATYYALNMVLRSMGKSVLMVDKPILSDRDVEREDNHSRRFAKEHYNISKQYYLNEFYKLNQLCDSFVLGSDQVWNYGISRNFGKVFYFDFADKEKKKIGYAVSFGHGVDFAPDEERHIISGLMSKLDGISVREEDGVKLCREQYGINATQVLDPVFLADPEIYTPLIEKSDKRETEPFIAAYILDPTPEKREALLRLSERMGGMKIIVMLDGLPWLFEKNKKLMALPNCVENLQVEDWLYYISRCEYLVTDSCHGASFGIIFGKNLTGVANKRRGYSRFESLFNLFDIKDHLITDMADAYKDDSLLKPIDYERVGEKMKSERERCYKWLSDILDGEKLSETELKNKNIVKA